MEFFTVYLITVAIALVVFLGRALYDFNWKPTEVPTQEYLTSVGIALIPVFNIIGVFIAMVCIIESVLSRMTAGGE